MPEDTKSVYDPGKKARIHRLMNVFALILAMAGALFLLYLFLTQKRDYYYFGIEFIPLLLLGFSAMILLMRYLQTGAIFKQPIPNETTFEGSYTGSYRVIKALNDQQDKIMELQSSISTIQDIIPKIVDGKQQEFSSEQQELLLNNLKLRIESSATDELLENLRQKATKQFEQDNKIELIDQSCSGTIERLNRETAALSRRGNLNLVLGIFTTIIGLFVLYIYVSKITVDASNPWIAGVNFLPRLSLVILIELFAYFFLKLYKANLSEIKYFQNELTNIEAKYVSLRTAILNKDENTISEVIKILSITERNFILEKGQSTVELEHTKFNNETTSSITKSISEMIKNIKLTNK